MVMGGIFKGASCSHHNRSFTYHRGGGGEEEEGDKEVKKEEEAVEVEVEEEEGEEGGDDDHGRPLQVSVLFPPPALIPIYSVSMFEHCVQKPNSFELLLLVLKLLVAFPTVTCYYFN